MEVNFISVVYDAKVMVSLIKQRCEVGWVINVASMAGMGGIRNGREMPAKTVHCESETRYALSEISQLIIQFIK
ncbi:MAG: hypothetical protein ACJARN_002244 [Arenicella sp.]